MSDVEKISGLTAAGHSGEIDGSKPEAERVRRFEVARAMHEVRSNLDRHVRSGLSVRRNRWLNV